MISMQVVTYFKHLKVRKKIVLTILLISLLLFTGALVYVVSREDSVQVPREANEVVPVVELTDEATIENIEEEKSSAREKTSDAEPKLSPKPVVEKTKWPVVYTLEQASKLTLVVNKKHKLPESYAPGLRPETSDAIDKLIKAASESGYKLIIISGYRSYQTQVSTYNRWVSQSGQAAADTFSARPGHSEHQTGLAVDVGAGNGVCDLEICFGNTVEGKWVAANAQKYGFIVRYPEGKDAITGYQYEPWHLRYVGTAEAEAITSSGLTMDQYYDVESGGYN
jgi:D-alanyl-D-alanine carboxypeptidase